MHCGLIKGILSFMWRIYDETGGVLRLNCRPVQSLITTTDLKVSDMTANNQSKKANLFLAQRRSGLLKTTAIVAVAFATSFALLPSAAQAQTQEWDTNPAAGVQGGTGNWDFVTTNWTTDGGATNVLYDGSNPVIPSAVFGGTAGTVTNIGSFAISDMSFTVDGYTINGDAIGLANAGSDISVSGAAANVAIITSVIAGTGNLTKSGIGQLNLEGDNIYTGTTLVTGGALFLAGPSGRINSSLVNIVGATFATDGGALTNSAVSINVALGGEFAVDAGSETVGSLSSQGTVNLFNGATLVVTGPSIGFTGTVNVDGAGTTLSLQDSDFGTATINTTGSIIDYGNGVSIGNAINVDSNTTQLQVLVGSAIQSGNIAELNGPRPIEKIGAGTLTLSGTNTYTGETRISAGTLSVTGGAAISDSSAVTVAAGAAFNVGADETVGSLAGAGTVTFGFAQTLTAGGDNTSTDFSGSMNSAAGRLTKAGTGTLTISGNNNSLAVVTVNGGTLLLTGANFDASAGFSVNSGILRTQNVGGNAIADTSVVTVIGAGLFEINNDETVGGVTGTGAVSLNGGTLTTGNAGNQNVSGVVSGVGGIVKQGAGTFTLSNAGNTFSGPITINAGQLTAAASGALGATTGAITLNGGILDLGGVVHTKGIAVMTGGTVQNGTINATTAAHTGGTITANVDAGIGVSAVGGTIAQITTGGVIASNATAVGIDVSTNSALLGGNINNAAGDGINLTNSGGGAVTVILGGTNVTGTDDGIHVVNSGGGLVSISGTGNIQGGANPGDDGIDIASDGAISITTTGTIVGDPGIVITSNGGGDLTVGGAGDVTGNLADGIFANTTGGNGNISITRDGNILGATNGVNAATSNVGAGTGAILITAQTGRTITGTSGIGVRARSEVGAITINGAGGIVGSTYGIDARTSAGGGISIAGTGTTSSSAANSVAINAETAGGNANVSVSRLGTVTNSGAGGVGIFASASGTGFSSVQVGAINMTNAGAGSIAVRALTPGTGNVTVITNGAITSAGTGVSSGIIAQGGGNVSVISRAITLAAASTGTAIDARTTGAGSTVDVTNNGALSGGAIGINTLAVNGATTITLAGDVTAADDAIRTAATGTGGITITGAGNITGGANAGDDGIDASTVSGSISISTTGTISGDPGVVMTSTGGGNLTLNGTGNVTGTAAEGVLATTTGGNGNIIITQNGSISGATLGVNALTSNGGAGTGTIAITAATGFTISGANGAGVRARSEVGGITVDGVGGITGTTFGVDARATAGGAVSVSGAGITSSSAANSVTINAEASGGNGNVTILRTGALTNAGAGGTGVFASSQGTGFVSVGTGAISMTSAGAGSTAIRANAAGTGLVTVNANGTITSTGTGASNGIIATGSGAVTATSQIITLAAASTGTAISAQSSGGGAVSVTTTGALNGGDYGINAGSTGAGAVTITTGAAIGNTDAPNIAGILTGAVNGDTLIALGGDVFSDGDGIRSITTGTGAVTVAGTGNILGGSVTSDPGDDGIDISTVSGAITIGVTGTITGDPGILALSSAGGNITINGTGNVVGTAFEGIRAISTGGNGIVNISQTGTVTGQTTGVDARSSNAGAGTGTVTVNAIQAITGTTVAGVITRTDNAANQVTGAGAITGATFGIDAQSLGGGSVTVDGTGATSSSAAGSRTINAQALAGGTVNVSRSGTVTNAGQGGIGINATAAVSGNVSVTSNLINMTNAGANSTAINAVRTGAVAGNVTVNSNGTITNAGTGTSNGINATNTSSGSVTVTSQAIDLTAASTGIAINAQSTGAGAVSVTTNGALNGGATGINADTTGTGTVLVTTNSTIGNTAAPTQFGIDTLTVSGTNTVNIAAGVTAGPAATAVRQLSTSGALSLTSSSAIVGGANGIVAISTSGAVTIAQTGATTGTNGFGIQAATSGSISVSAAAVDAGTTGVSAVTTGAASTVAVTTSGAVGGTVVPSNAGIITSAVGGATTVTIGANVSSKGDGISSTATGAGTLTISGDGNITGGANAGDDGIQTSAGSGATAISVNGMITGNRGVFSSATSGAISLTGSGNVTGTGAEGVLAQTSAGGNITINRTAIYVGLTDGISAFSDGGTVTITTDGNVTGTTGSGINIGGAVGITNVTAGNTVTGGVNAILSSATTSTVNNAGSLNVAVGAPALTRNVFNVTAGALTLNNTGTAFGGIQSSAGTSTTFNNQLGGTWTLIDLTTSTLNGVADTIVNDGNIISNGTVTFTGLEVFNNNSFNTLTINGVLNLGPAVAFSNIGRIDMSNGVLTDRLNISGTWTAAGASQIDLDIDLGSNNPGAIQLSDQLVITNGGTTGATVLNFNRINAGPNVLQDNDIVVVDVEFGQVNNGTFSTTTLPPPGGLIEYNLLKQAATDDWVVRSSLNVALIGSITSSIQSTLSVLGSVVNRPSSPFVSSPIAAETDSCAPGVWGRGTGGSAIANVNSALALPAGTATSNKTSMLFGGFQGGVDFGCFDLQGNGANVAAGVTGGFNTGSSTTALVRPGNIGNSVTKSEFDQKFVGTYVSYQNGGFFADLQSRVDFTDFKLSNNLAAVGLNNVKIDNRRYSMTGTVAYSKSVGDFNLVPAAGASYSRSFTETVLFADGSRLKIQDQDDFLAFAGLTLNTAIIVGDLEDENADISVYTPFITGTVYNEFGGDPRAQFIDPVGNTRFVDTENLGLYGEVSAGVGFRKIYAAEDANVREVSASVRVDYKFGNNVESLGATGQIRWQW